MMNLKLAEYNLETGKFESFLELGRDFYFGGSEIFVEMIFNGGNIDFPPISIIGNLFQKDGKDPLNRFDGLFNGRTYGNGRFVLIEKIYENYQDDLLENWVLDRTFVIGRGAHDYLQNQYLLDCKLYSDRRYPIDIVTHDEIFLLRSKDIICGRTRDELMFTCKTVGNLHEKPELWEKIK